jgi:hypothetical protein
MAPTFASLNDAFDFLNGTFLKTFYWGGRRRALLTNMESCDDSYDPQPWGWVACNTGAQIYSRCLISVCWSLVEVLTLRLNTPYPKYLRTEGFQILEFFIFWNICIKLHWLNIPDPKIWTLKCSKIWTFLRDMLVSNNHSILFLDLGILNLYHVLSTVVNYKPHPNRSQVRVTTPLWSWGTLVPWELSTLTKIPEDASVVWACLWL